MFDLSLSYVFEGNAVSSTYSPEAQMIFSSLVSHKISFHRRSRLPWLFLGFELS